MGIIEVISKHELSMFDIAPIIFFIEENKQLHCTPETVNNFMLSFLFSSIFFHIQLVLNSVMMNGAL